MQKLPKIPSVAIGALICFGVIVLGTSARGWQTPSTDSLKGLKSSSEEAAAEPPPVASPEATQLMQAARDRLSQWQSVQARIVERVDLGEQRFKAEGRYLAGEFPKTRLEFQVHVGDTTGSLLEICDGQVLHIQRTVDSQSQTSAGSAPAEETTGQGDRSSSKPVIETTRRDVQQILKAAPGAANKSLPIRAADLGLGGISAVLASLERCMVFESVRDEEFDGRTFKVVQGRWKPEYRAALLEKIGPALAQLQPFLPDKVRIDFEASTLFPVRLAYLKLISKERKSYRPMVMLEFHDVEFDVSLPPETFAYQVPPGVEETDDTATFVQLLEGPPAPPSGAARGRSAPLP